MSMTEVPLPKEPKRRDRCSIDISSDGIRIWFEPDIPDGPHKPTSIEVMAAGALLGVAGVLTGLGREQVVEAMKKFDARAKRSAR